jgi:hypothetical protein
MTFRSGYNTATTPPTFPIIADPQTTPGNTGDVRSDDNFAEFLTLINNCRQQWQTNYPNVVGITSLHINQFVDVNGNPSNAWGLGGIGVHSNTASQNIAGRAMMVDSFHVLQLCGGIWPNVDSKLVGHEYGHALSFGHGNGIDDDNDGDLDEDTNADGTPDESGDSLFNGNLMQYQSTCNDFANAITLTTAGTVSQRGWSRDQATLHIPDIEVDPVLSPLSSMKVDTVGELPMEKYLDIDAMLVAVDVRKGSTTFALSTFGLIPNNQTLNTTVVNQPLNTTVVNQPLNTTLDYYFLADLDNNPGTGGEPAKLGIPTRFQGAEFIGKVTVGPGTENYVTQPTIWRSDNETFIETVSPNNVQSEVLTDRVTITPAPGKRIDNYSQDIANIVTLTISNELRGLVADSIRLEAISVNPSIGTVDIGEGGNFPLIQPSFPVCQVEPPAGRPGDSFVIHATGLAPNSDVHAILGDDEVAKGVTDSKGNVFLQFRSVEDVASGVRLMTVGTAALTADCTLKIIPSEILVQNSSGVQ